MFSSIFFLFGAVLQGSQGGNPGASSKITWLEKQGECPQNACRRDVLSSVSISEQRPQNSEWEGSFAFQFSLTKTCPFNQG